MTKEELRLRVPAQASAMAGVRHAVCALAEAAGASEPVVGDVALAVGEACGNVVLHAYRDCDAGDLIVHAVIADDELVVEVEDRGGGMAPRSDSSGLGLGLPLMTTVSDSMTVSSGPDGLGTRVRLVFSLRAA